MIMADYWKSQPRFFCDFCKCWLADNKPSKEFHEKGKRHQENVKKRISEMQKKGIEDAKAKEEMSESMSQMEKAAIEAFKKDLASNPALAAQYGIKPKVHTVENRPEDYRPTQTEEEEEDDEDKKPKAVSSKKDAASEKPPKKIGKWHKAESAEGYTYYWNDITSESVWVKPDDYESDDDIAEESTQVEAAKQEQSVPQQQSATSRGPQHQEMPLSTQQTTTETASRKRKKDELGPPGTQPVDLPVTPDILPLECSFKASGELHSIPLPADIPLPPDKPSPEPEHEDIRGPKVPKAADKAYGQWETVQEVQEEQVDLELPKIEASTEAKSIVATEPKLKFREKKVDTLGKELVAFKKRKAAAGGRQLKKREDDS